VTWLRGARMVRVDHWRRPAASVPITHISHKLTGLPTRTPPAGGGSEADGGVRVVAQLALAHGAGIVLVPKP